MIVQSDSIKHRHGIYVFLYVLVLTYSRHILRGAQTYLTFQSQSFETCLNLFLFPSEKETNR